MDIISLIIDLVTGAASKSTSKPHYGNLDRDNLAYSTVCADRELDAASRQGPAALSAALAKWGFKSEEQFAIARGSVIEQLRATGRSGDFVEAQQRYQLEQAQAKMGGVALVGDQSPVEGVGLGRLAEITARREVALQRGGAAHAAQLLAQFGLDEARFQRVYATWMSRMNGSADGMSAMILSSMWNTQLHVARSTAARGA